MRLRSLIAYTASAAAAVSLLLPSVAFAQQPQQTYTGRQIFEGTFFGAGPLADAHPAFRINRVQVAGGREAGASTLRALEARMQRVDPSYFREIGPQLTSGDPGTVQAAVTRTASDLDRSMTAGMRSKRARKLATVTPVSFPETVAVRLVVTVAVLDIDLANVGTFVIIAAPPPLGRTQYQSERAIAALTAQLASITAAS